MNIAIMSEMPHQLASEGCRSRLRTASQACVSRGMTRYDFSVPLRSDVHKASLLLLESPVIGCIINLMLFAHEVPSALAAAGQSLADNSWCLNSTKASTVLMNKRNFGFTVDKEMTILRNSTFSLLSTTEFRAADIWRAYLFTSGIALLGMRPVSQT